MIPSHSAEAVRLPIGMDVVYLGLWGAHGATTDWDPDGAVVTA